MFYYPWMCSAAAVKNTVTVLCWERSFITLDQNLLRVGVGGWKSWSLEPGLLSETLVLVPLTPSKGAVIAAILHKLSIEFLPKCAFLHHIQPSVLMKWQCHLIHCVPLLSLCSLLSSLILPLSLSFSPSLSYLCFSHLWGRVMNIFPALIGWCMKLLGRMKAYITQRIWNGSGGKNSRSWDPEMFWHVALKQRGWGALQMLPCNNGSRSHFHWCLLHPGTLPLGNCPPDPILYHPPAPCATPKKTGRLRSAPGPSPESVCEDMGEV